MKRCIDRLGGDRCAREAGHDGMHRNRRHVWAFTDWLPEWRRRMAGAA